MFKPSELLIDAYVQRICSDFIQAFGDGEPDRLRLLRSIAQMALTSMCRSNAAYTNATMTLLTVQVGTDILRGRLISGGDISADDWLHFEAASLCYMMGFVRGSVQGDTGRVCVIDDAGATIELERGKSDGALYPWGLPRSKLFVCQTFRGHRLIDGERLAGIIEYTYYPAPRDRLLETGNWGGLLRGAQTIAVVADPLYTLRLKDFYMQLAEAGLAQSMGFHSAAEVHDSMPSSFWKYLYPKLTGGAIEYLKQTPEGRFWITNMNLHMRFEEHRQHVPAP